MSTKIDFVITLFLFSVCLLFVACQKEEIKEVGAIVAVPNPILLDSAQFEGNFHGQIYEQKRTLPPYDFDRVGDQVLRVYVENGSIRVLNYIFPIDSLSQTHFDESYIPGPNSYDNTKKLTLVYSADYRRILLKYEYSCYNGPINGCINSKLEFDGLRTSIKGESVLPHANVAALVGTYNLSVSLKDTEINQDTQYTTNVLITTSGNTFVFGQKSFGLGLFEGYRDHVSYEYYTYNGYLSEKRETRFLYWHNDSLSMKYLLTENDNGLKDTIEYSYSGIKQ